MKPHTISLAGRHIEGIKFSWRTRYYKATSYCPLLSCLANKSMNADVFNPMAKWRFEGNPRKEGLRETRESHGLEADIANDVALGHVVDSFPVSIH